MNEWVLLVGIGVLSYFSQILNIHAYSWGEASLLAPLDYMRLLYATILGWIVFETLPGPYTWAGALVIIAAAIWSRISALAALIFD